MRLAGIIVGLALLATSAAAQTDDHLYTFWEWGTEPGFARALGLGGAFVAVADDSGATVANPAGLGQLRRFEIAAGGMQRQSASRSLLSGGQSWASRMGIGAVGGGALLTPTWALGGYLIEPHALDQSLSWTDSAGGREAMSMRTVVTEVGAVSSWRVGERTYVGVRLTATHLELEGEWTLSDASTPSGLRQVGSSSGSTRITGGAGVLARLTDSVRLGIAGQVGAAYEADRNDVDLVAKENLEVGGTYSVRQPSRVSGGLSWQASPKLLLSAQLDYVRYSEIEVAARLRADDAGNYVGADGVEPRAGVELSLPVGTMSLQLRGGVHLRAAGDIEYTGDDGAEKQLWSAWPDRSSTEISVGASVVRRALRLDVGALVGGLRPVVVGTVTFRP